MQQTKEAIFEYLRPGFVYGNDVITDDYGVKYALVQLSRGPRRGVLAATVIDGKISIGISLLSPDEPINTYQVVEREINGKSKKVSQRVKNINWDKATQVAIARAKKQEPNPVLRYEWQADQLAIFEKRARNYFKTV
jgi:hypothetical protein